MIQYQSMIQYRNAIAEESVRFFMEVSLEYFVQKNIWSWISYKDMDNHEKIRKYIHACKKYAIYIDYELSPDDIF